VLDQPVVNLELGSTFLAGLMREFGVRSRPEGQVLAVGLVYQMPRSRTAARPSGT